MSRIALVEDPGSDVFGGKKMVIEEVDVPEPKSGEVLVRVAAAPINPSDSGKWKSAKIDPEKPLWLGNEGSGYVVKSGGGIKANNLLGQKVGITNMKNGGSYQEYVCVSALEGVFPLPADVPVEDACSFFVNPYTAVGLMATAKEVGSPGFVHTAAASQLGQMLVKLCAKEKVTLINVVRRDEQAEVLKALGAEHIVVSSKDSWKEDLAALVKEHNITCAFDAISGDNVGDIMSAMPKKSTTFVYGGLSGKPIGNIPTMEMIYFGKKVEGWLLPTYLRGASGGTMGMAMRINNMSKVVNPGLASGGWATSQFVDVAPEEMWGKFLEMQKGQITNQKLRIRFPQPEPVEEAPAAAAEMPAAETPATTAEAPGAAAEAPSAAETPAAAAETPAATTEAPAAETPAATAETPAATAETPAAETPAAAAEAPQSS